MANEEQQEYRATGTEFKHEDTTQVMRIRFIAGNRFPVYPTEGHKFVAKIGKAYGSYIGDYPVSVSGNSFEVKSSDLKGLDNGGYRLEIWESYIDSEGNTQTGIFPSPRAFVSFTINQNIEDTAWNLVKDISFQDLVNTAVVAAGQNIVVAGTNTLPAGSQASVTQKYENSKNEFTFNIPEGQQGPKGDPGDPGVPGTPGIQGLPGKDGHTPVRGTDYWTDADKQAIQAEDQKYIENTLSKINLEPETFENEAALKAKYPNGKPGIMVTADTGHKWLWINGAWKDCGVYQSASPTNETLDARKWNTKLGRVTSDSLGNAIRDQLNQVEAQFNNILDTAIPDMTDQSGKIVPKQKLKLDKSLTSEVLPAQAKAVRDAITLQPERYQQPFTWHNESLPILKIEGQIPAADGVKSQVSYSYQDMNGSATLKWQGQSSLSFPKKNFTIKFDKSFTAKGGWLATDTYVLKGNFNDYTHARNIVSARLWGDVVKSRGWSTEDILDNDGTPLLDNDGTPLQIYQDTMPGLINGGAIDGFPIMLVVNGDFYGLYDFQIKKSRTMFGFEKDNHSQYAISCERTPQNKNGAAIHFKGAAILDGNDYDYEYVADDGDKANAKASLNYMLQKVVDATGSDYAKTLEGYLDVDSVIDYMLFTALITAADDVTKNFLMLSYNGTKWYFSAYDMDCTFGNWQDGWIREDPDHAVPSIQHWRDANRAMHLVCAYDADRVKARYQELRKGPLSDANVYKRFISYMSLTPVAVKNADVKLWPTTPATNAHNFAQIYNEFKLRTSVIDAQIAEL